MRSILPAVVLLLTIVVPAGALELPYRHSELQVRSAFLLNFAKFTDWPPSAFSAPEAPLVISVDDPAMFAMAREKLSGRSVDGHPVVVRRFRVNEPGDPPHLLYLVDAERPPAGLGPLAVLTVGGRPGFSAAGGHIELVRRGGRIGFGVNRAALRRSGLAVSSQVLELAVFVHETERDVR